MGRRSRRNHSPAFKAKVVVAAIKGEKTMIGLAQEFDVHPNQNKLWRDQLLEGATGVFGEAPKAEPEPTNDVKTLHAKIGEAPQPATGPQRSYPSARTGDDGTRTVPPPKPATRSSNPHNTSDDFA